MPVFNAARFVDRAIRSILEQSMGDFELLVIDDCSTDGSRELLAAHRDSRIRLLGNAQNIGLGPTLNRGIRESAGEYVARMDADDVSFPKRLELQAAFLDREPGIGLCGGGAVTFHSDEEIDFHRRGDRLAETPAALRMGLLFGPGVIHPTVMFRRRSFVEKGLWYRPLRYAQDYELWTRAFFILDPANIPDTVLWYRIHPDNAASRVRDTQELVKQHIWKPLLERLGIEANGDELEAHSQLADLRVTPDWSLVLGVHEWLLKLRKVGCGDSWWDEAVYQRLLSQRLFGFLQYATQQRLRPLHLALTSSLHPLRTATVLEAAKFVAKCLIGYQRKSRRAA